MTFDMDPETLQGLTRVCGTVCFVTLVHLVNKCINLRRQRRSDALFLEVVRDTMASGHPFTFNGEEITKKTK